MLSGHYWTLKCHVEGRLRPAKLGASQPWSTVVQDASLGAVRIGGALHCGNNGRQLLVVVHGLGGNSQSVYSRRAAHAAASAGMACLRIDLRGADQHGEDLYHAGLVSDLDAALESPELANYSEVSILGYSLGGHVALRYAAQARCARIRSVVAVCPPLDLALSSSAFDRPALSVYRGHVMSSLRAMYLAFRKRRPEWAPLDPGTLNRIRRIRDWDEAVVVPRHGFETVQHYYAEMSAARVLRDVSVPTLVVHAERDPMVPIDTVRRALQGASSMLRRHESKQGGHVGFPANFSLDQDAPAGLETQLIAWSRAPSV